MILISYDKTLAQSESWSDILNIPQEHTQRTFS